MQIIWVILFSGLIPWFTFCDPNVAVEPLRDYIVIDSYSNNNATDDDEMEMVLDFYSNDEEDSNTYNRFLGRELQISGGSDEYNDRLVMDYDEEEEEDDEEDDDGGRLRGLGNKKKKKKKKKKGKGKGRRAQAGGGGGEQRLKVLGAKHNLIIGTAINSGQFRNKKYVGIVKGNFNLIVPEFECHFSRIVPAPGSYNWKLCDKVFAFSKQNKLNFKFHSIIWYKNVPFWFSKKPPKNTLAYIKDYIKKVNNRYKGIKYWDVINEAIDEKKGNRLRNIPAVSKVPNWFGNIFRVTREVLGKNAVLIYNDYLISSVTGFMKAKTMAAFNLVNKNKKYVDAVGFQLHVEKGYNFWNGLRQIIKRYGKIGVAVHFTEVDCRNCPYQIQKKIYYNLMLICRTEPNCKMFIVWGIGRSAWGPNSSPLMWDKNLNKKPAFYGVVDALKKK